MGVDKFGVVKSFDGNDGVDSVVCVDIEQILNCASLGVLCAFRNLVYLQPVAAALAGEEDDVAVHRGGVD